MRKRYGDSLINHCPFCGKSAFIKNKQGIPVCADHKKNELSNLKCACGSWLDIATGKWGPYFRCMHCGNISFRKGLDMNPSIAETGETKKVHEKKEVKEIVVRSDELDFI